MVPTETPSHSHLLRSKRTRNATPSDDSIKLPATKKRRSALRRDTFEPLNGSSLNEIAGRALHDTKPNGAPIEHAPKPSPNPPQARELTLRGGKKNEKRSERGMGLLTLSTNDFYSISQLPALPDQIRSRPTVSYSCIISPDNDYILALTHTDALVWSYNATASTPTSRELLSFALPFPLAITEDPLPLGAFTAKSANGEPGIIVVSPKWGKIVYWESLTSASSYAPTQASNGIQASIPGMFSGELVKELVPAEPAGFILTLASGRVAQLTVRDQMGRPGIGVQFMRKSIVGNAKAGIFGSIRSVFGADRRKGTAIARPGRIARAQRDIILCTEDGEVEFWTNNLLTGNQLFKTASVKDQLWASLEPHIDQGLLQQPLQVKVVDFSLHAPVSQDLVKTDDATSCPLMFLIAVSSHQRSMYYLLEALLVDETAQVRVVHPVHSYTHGITEDQSFRPRICIPNTSKTAFVLFEKATVLISLIKIQESPSSQLLGEKTALPTPFQDCIRFQDDTIYRTINFAAEDTESGPSCVLAIQGFGVVRIVSHLPDDNELDVEDVVSQLGPKARIEQAIFFGSRKSNPLDLRQHPVATYPNQDVRHAILTISREVVRSTSKHIAKSSSSITEHLQYRAHILQDLIEYCLKVYPNCLDRADRFLLLWNAEKVAAAQALWKVQEQIQATYPRNDDRDMTYLNFALLALSEDRQRYPNPEKGESDHVRHWLIHSVNETGRLLVELQDAMHELAEMHVNDPRIVCDYFLEGTNLWTAAFQTALKFREDNAAIYGLGNETFDNGILLQGYPASLPPAWTSTIEQVHHSQDYIKDVCVFLSDWWDYVPIHQNGSANPHAKKTKPVPTNLDGEPYEAPSRSSLHELADHLTSQVSLVNRMILEANIQQRVQVDASQDTEEQKNTNFQALAFELRQITSKTITDISPFNRDGSIALAEDQKDTDLLVTLNLDYLAELSRRLKSHPDEEQSIRRRIRDVQDHVETYFTRFGNDWAYSHFSSMIERGELGRLIGEGQVEDGKKQSFVSWFFDNCARHDKRLGKIAWINCVAGESKFDAACQTLETVAEGEESDIWSKKTELCLAKLAGLAALETAKATTVTETRIGNIDFELEYLHIIESLAFHINTVTYNAVDDEAAVQIAIERFIPKHISTSKKAHQSRKSLSEAIYKLVTNQMVNLGQLIDALTLLELGELVAEEINADVDDITDNEYPFALQAIDLAPLREASLQQKDSLRKTVWRRLLIKDNWTEINQTAGKSDVQVKAIMQNTILFRTLLSLTKRANEDHIEIHFPSIDEILEADKSQAEKFSDETKTELAQLKKFVDKARLKEHYGGLLQDAKSEYRHHQDMLGDMTANDVFGASNGQVNGGHS